MREAIPKIGVPPPGPGAQKIIGQEDRVLATSTKHLPLAIRNGRGALVEDVDGNVYLDFASGVCVTNIGHCPPRVLEAVREQAGRFLYFAGTDFYYEVQAQTAEKLSLLTPGLFPKKVFFTNSGAETVEAAIKLAKRTTQRHQFISFIGGFHGRTLGANAFMGCKNVQRQGYFPMMPGVLQVPYAYCYRCAYHERYPRCDVWCARILEEVYFKQIMAPEEVAAVLVEPIQGEGGYVVPPEEFLRELGRICRKYGILFIADEIQTGLGRTGKMFAVEYASLIPEVVTVAKGIASGLPMGALVFRSDLDFPVKGAHSNTFGGNPVCCAAALATIETIEEERLTAKARTDGDYVAQRMKVWQEKYDFIGDVRGRGLFLACEFVSDRTSRRPAVELVDDLVHHCFGNGLVLMPCGFSSVRLIPPLNIPRFQLDAGLEIFESGLEHVARRFARYA